MTTEPLIIATGLTKKFGDFTAVNGIDFAVQPGEAFGFLVPTASAYGAWAWLLQVSPLYHGVALIRAANAGQASWGVVGHVAFLVSMALAGLWVVSKRLKFLLLK
jgi:lipooligosaccharide transport system permease protein